MPVTLPRSIDCAFIAGAALVAVAAAVNAFWFAWTVGIPLPNADDWYFIHAFVGPALDGSLGFRDFFVQREGNDHVQPLQKLLLLLILRHGELDFRLQGMIGLCFALLTLGLLLRVMLRGSADGVQRCVAVLGAMIVVAVAFSLNSTNLYTWTLVTLFWLLLFIIVGYWLLLSRGSDAYRLGCIALAATLFIAFVLDELAIPVWIAAVAAAWIRDGRRTWKPAAAIAIAGGISLAMGRPVIAWLSPLHMETHLGTSTIGQVAGLLVEPESWRIVLVPLADSLVHRTHLDTLGGDGFTVLLGIILLVAHGAFWWRALVSRNLPSRTGTFLAVALMLLFYASIAGIVSARVALTSPEYLHQPRYVVIYQLNIIALALMFFSPPGDLQGRPARQRPRLAWAGAVAIAVVGLQVAVSMQAWKSAPYIREYVENAAATMWVLAAVPEQLPEDGCPDILAICREPAGHRAEVFELLRQNHLNIFSPRFQAWHALPAREELVEAAQHRAAAPRACPDSLGGWGPSVITPGEGFNLQPDGRSAYWVRLDAAQAPFQLFFGGEQVDINWNGDVATFFHSEAMQAAAESGQSLEFSVICADGGAVAFEVDVLVE